MAVEHWVRAEIDAVVEDWLRERRMFTAFEVSLAVRQGGVNMRHRELRDDVHESLQLFSGRAGYTRTLRDVGGPVEAWIYHHWKDSAWTYTPLDRSTPDAPAVSFNNNYTSGYDSPLLPATRPAYSSGVALADHATAVQQRHTHQTAHQTAAAQTVVQHAPAKDGRLTRRSENVTQLELRPDETAVVVCNELETDVIIHNAKRRPADEPTVGQWLMSWVCKILDC